MKGSIRRRLVLFLALPLVALKLCDTLYYYYANVADARRADSERLNVTARVLAAGLTDSSGAAPSATALRVAAPLMADGDLRYGIISASGTLVGGEASLPTLAPVAQQNPVYGDATIDGQPMRLLTYRVNSLAGPLTINVGSLSRSTARQLNIPVWRRLLWDFFELDMSLLLIWLGVHFGLRPLDRLRREIDARSADDLNPIRETPVHSELRPLLQSLNRLLDMQNSAVRAQSEFVANAAHQLRTPIAGLVAQLELLIADNRDPASAERLARLASGLRQLTRSANQLLTLSRAESGINQLVNKVQVDLKDLVTDAAGRWVDRAIGLNIELSAEAEPAVVRADPSLLEEMLGNLVDNALNNTPSGGEITIYSGLDDGQPFLMVDDTGPGIAPAERARVLERFYRTPGSRGTGTGLGLAIVDEIVRLYGATLSINAPPGGRGTRVRIVWPATGAAPGKPRR